MVGVPGGLSDGRWGTQNLKQALTPLFDGMPKAARHGREVFAAQLHRELAARGVLCRDSGVLRRLDRVDCVILHSSLLVGDNGGIDPAAEGMVSIARRAGMRVVIAGDRARRLRSLRPDKLVDGGTTSLLHAVRDQQKKGHVVALVARGPSDALAAADCGIGVLQEGEPPPWGAHLLCGEELDEPALIISACRRAHAASSESADIALAGATLGGFMAARTLARGAVGRVMFGVNAAAVIAMGNSLRHALSATRQFRLPRRDRTPWHELSVEEVMSRLGSGREGLSDSEAEMRHQRTMRSAPAGGGGFGSALWDELKNPLTPVLAGGAGLSAAVGSPGDAAIVGAALLLNSLIGAAERARAEKDIAALERTESQRVRVRRNGRELSVDSDHLVRGDLVLLRSGEVVPADCRMLQGQGVEVDESSLTGESLPVRKSESPTSAAAISERSCILYEGTTVVSGRVEALAVAVGQQTESRRAILTSGAPPPSGTEVRLRQITKLTLPIALGSAGVLIAIGLARQRTLRELAGAGVSLAVASVPEGLPVLATIAQLAAARRLSRRGALVRNPGAMEALSGLDVLCADKTGTMTEGKLWLAGVSNGRHFERAPELSKPYRAILSAAVRASPRRSGNRELAHATDEAVVGGAERVGVGEEEAGKWSRMSELPFQPDRGYHAVAGNDGSRTLVTVKGAPEVVIPRCATWAVDSGSLPLEDGAREELEAEARRMAEDGLRVLAIADRNGGGDGQQLDESDMQNLTFRGFVGLSDPIRPSAREAVGRLHKAQVRVIMITGDHPSTAARIAEEAGLRDGEGVLTGPDIDSLDDSALDEALQKATVIARATPTHKTRIVQALQRGGRIVGMTGDGANDAPAIRLANVGIALGSRATHAARSAADLIVVDDRIETILDTVVEGRAMWGSVRDAVSVLVGGNLGEVGYSLAGGIVDGIPPLNARQIMLMNLLTDAAPALAIAVRPPRGLSPDSVLQEGPRAALGKALTRDIAVRGLLTGSGAAAAWWTTRLLWRKESASTVGLLSLVGSQLGQTVAAGIRDRNVLLSGLGSAALLVAIVETPGLRRAFGCRRVGVRGLATAAAASVVTTAISRVATR